LQDSNLRTIARERASPRKLSVARENMVTYKVPRIAVFADALPKCGSGKSMWYELQERENA